MPTPQQQQQQVSSFTLEDVKVEAEGGHKLAGQETMMEAAKCFLQEGCWVVQAEEEQRPKEEREQRRAARLLRFCPAMFSAVEDPKWYLGASEMQLLEDSLQPLGYRILRLSYEVDEAVVQVPDGPVPVAVPATYPNLKRFSDAAYKALQDGARVVVMTPGHSKWLDSAGGRPPTFTELCNRLAGLAGQH